MSLTRLSPNSLYRSCLTPRSSSSRSLRGLSAVSPAPKTRVTALRGLRLLLPLPLLPFTANREASSEVSVDPSRLFMVRSFDPSHPCARSARRSARPRAWSRENGRPVHLPKRCGSFIVFEQGSP